MKKLRDFFYDKNDIILALIILAVAGLLIVWRVDVIMAYPETLAKETKTEKTTKHDAVDTTKESKEQKDDADKASDTKNDTKEEAKAWDSEGRLSADMSLSISDASPEEALDSLVRAGLFNSHEEIEKDFASVGASVESLKSGTFKLNKGASKADVISILTK